MKTHGPRPKIMARSPPRQRLKSSSVETLLSGLSLSIFWAYLELQRLDFPSFQARRSSKSL